VMLGTDWPNAVARFAMLAMTARDAAIGSFAVMAAEA
jgi:hypothetical protein